MTDDLLPRPLAERVTRLETQYEGLLRELTSQVRRDSTLHTDLAKLIEKQDERMDREHDERLALAADLRTLVRTAAMIGGVVVVLANIIAPLAIKLLVP